MCCSLSRVLLPKMLLVMMPSVMLACCHVLCAVGGEVWVIFDVIWLPILVFNFSRKCLAIESLVLPQLLFIVLHISDFTVDSAAQSCVS